mgnify:CR=1 FL=1
MDEISQQKYHSIVVCHWIKIQKQQHRQKKTKHGKLPKKMSITCMVVNY